MKWAEPKVRKEDYVRPALRRMERAEKYGVYFILKSMEQGQTFRSTVPRFDTADPNYRILARQRSRFTHYYFYIRDETLGPMVMRVASFFPFQATYFSLEAQEAKIRAMAVVQGAELVELIVDGGESAKNLDRPGMDRLLALVEERKVDTVIIAKLDRLTRSVKDLAELLERFQKRSVSLVSVAESLDTGSAAGRLVINIMPAVSQWEREAIGERTRDAMNHKRSNGERVGNIAYGYRLAVDNRNLEPDRQEQSRAHNYPGLAREALHASRDSGGTERSRTAYAASFGLAAGARCADCWRP